MKPNRSSIFSIRRSAFDVLLSFLLFLAAVGPGFGQPVLTDQPQHQTVAAGTTATFTVGVTGTEPLAYQWQQAFDLANYVDRPEGTNSTLVITNVQYADAGNYRVIVTNVDGPVTSDVALLSLLLPPWNAAVQPTNSSVSLGDNLKLRVTASGTTPFGYQWCLNAIPLSGRTNSTLSLTNVQLADAGAYTAVVTNVAGAVTSRVATLSVDPTFTKITTGPLATDAAHWHGATWGDYNNDGYPDLYVHQVAPTQDFIYCNNGNGTFTRLTAPIPQGLASSQAAWGNAWGDYDNDGYLDLFISNSGAANLLLHHRGNGTFERIFSGPGAEGYDSSGPVWGDYDRDGYPDLFVVNGSVGSYPARHWLYHNQGNGTLARMTTNQVGSIASDSVLAAFGTWVDYDENGWPDMFLPTSPARGCFYRNQGDGSFVHLNGVLTSSAFGLAWADYDNDGRLDVCIGGYGTPTVLYHNEGGGAFRQKTAAQVGIPATDMSWGGGVAWGDYDNDGYLDLFIGGGWWTGSGSGRALATKCFLYHNNGDGTFARVTPGSPVYDISESMGVHWVDYDRDGFLDLFVNNHGAVSAGANLLYRNTGNSNNWLCVNCVGTASPRFGTGAKVRAQATIRGSQMSQFRLIDAGGTCWGGQSFVAHFGLGDATNVDVLRIEWTSGIVQEVHNVPASQYLTVTEPAKLSMPEPGDLHIQCWKGMSYRIEGSSDLLAWNLMATVTNLTGTLQWKDPEAPRPSTRFYRTVKE
jgi:enediyne biosynthesis protein E4